MARWSAKADPTTCASSVIFEISGIFALQPFHRATFATFAPSRSPFKSQVCQPLLFVKLQEGVDQVIEVALHDLIEVEVLVTAAFAAEAVIGAAVLGEVVGADALGAVAGAHHGFAVG